MYKLVKITTLFLSISFIITSACFSEPDITNNSITRLALVIGNSNYKAGRVLENPVNDAKTIKTALETTGFQVIIHENCKQCDMNNAIDNFEKQVKNFNTVLFFYSGYGVQVNGVNYLIPIDSDLKNIKDIDKECIKIEKIITTMQNNKQGSNIMIIDACRDNPFEQNWNNSSQGKGLALMNAPPGTFIAYSNSPGKTAPDSEEHNSLYTSALIQHITTPGITIAKMFQNVRKTVIEKSNGKQIPWEISSLANDFYFVASSTPNTYKDPITGAEFVYINPGSFIMGSPLNETGRYENEKDHKVTLTKGFYMQTTEVTQGQWKKVMDNNPSFFINCGDNCPVERVSWEDVQNFIEKLNQMSGKNKFSLPTEAQWEYAAKAGSTTRFSWGDNEDCTNANYGNGKWSEECIHVNPSQTMEVKSFKPNNWGLYDMHGNVWEWCQDWYGDYPSEHVIDPKGPSSGEDRVERGGAWLDDARYCRHSFRSSDSPDYRDNYDLGFRLIMHP